MGAGQPVRAPPPPRPRPLTAARSCFETADAERAWPFAAASADFVHMRLVAHELGSHAHALAEAARVLAPGGFLETVEAERARPARPPARAPG